MLKDPPPPPPPSGVGGEAVVVAVGPGPASAHDRVEVVPDEALLEDLGRLLAAVDVVLAEAPPYRLGVAVYRAPRDVIEADIGGGGE